MKRVFRYVVTAAAVLACTAGMASRASAATMTICQTLACSGAITITDNGVNDSSPVAGQIVWIGSAFGYSFNVNTGVTKDILGSASAPQLDINFSVTNSSPSDPADPNDIWILFSDTGYNLTPGGTTLKFHGNSGAGDAGDAEARAWGGNSNNINDLGKLISSTGSLPAGGAGFNTVLTNTFAATANPYSLTVGVRINRNTFGSTTGDLNFQIQPVPEPASMTLLGLGLVGLAARGRRALKK